MSPSDAACAARRATVNFLSRTGSWLRVTPRRRCAQRANCVVPISLADIGDKIIEHLGRAACLARRASSRRGRANGARGARRRKSQRQRLPCRQRHALCRRVRGEPPHVDQSEMLELALKLSAAACIPRTTTRSRLCGWRFSCACRLGAVAAVSARRRWAHAAPPRRTRIARIDASAARLQRWSARGRGLPLVFAVDIHA